MGSYRRAWEPSPAAIATSRRGVRPIRLRLARQSGAPDREDPGNDPPRCGKCAVTINGRLDGATHSPVPRMWMIGCGHPLSDTEDVDGPFRPSYVPGNCGWPLSTLLVQQQNRLLNMRLAENIDGETIASKHTECGISPCVSLRPGTFRTRHSNHLPRARSGLVY